MNTKHWNIFIVLFLILLVSCKKNNPKVVSNNTDTTTTACTNSFTFLTNGDSLTYNIVLFGTPSTSIVSYKSTSNAGTFVQKISDPTDPIFDNQVVYMRGCNGWLTTSSTTTVNDTSYFMKEIRSVGNSWKNYDSTGPYIYDYTVAQINISTTVPAGTFTCDKILYNEEGTINTDTIWWNNKYGTIKYAGVLLSQELISKNY
jgi:hypothetical protein